MTIFWRCFTTANSNYNKNIEYISEPSKDLIDKFKEEIVCFENPKDHIEYIPCNQVERSQGNILFILFSRVEIIIKPHKETHELEFVHCQDNQ